MFFLKENYFVQKNYPIIDNDKIWQVYQKLGTKRNFLILYKELISKMQPAAAAMMKLKQK